MQRIKTRVGRGLCPDSEKITLNAGVDSSPSLFFSDFLKLQMPTKSDSGAVAFFRGETWVNSSVFCSCRPNPARRKSVFRRILPHRTPKKISVSSLPVQLKNCSISASMRSAVPVRSARSFVSAASFLLRVLSSCSHSGRGLLYCCPLSPVTT